MHTLSETFVFILNGTLVVARSRSSVFDRTFSYPAPKLWNTLSNTERNFSSLNSFKSKFSLKILLFFEVQEMFSSHGGLLTIAMYHH